MFLDVGLPFKQEGYISAHGVAENIPPAFISRILNAAAGKCATKEESKMLRNQHQHHDPHGIVPVGVGKFFDKEYNIISM
jgi:hypothetical protein